MTRHFILTGAPGAGKTVLIRQLEWEGQHVVEEAATDVIALQQAQGIAEPWQDPQFIADIAALQLRRQAVAQAAGGETQFHDRSLFCTLALAEHLGHPVPPVLEDAVARALAEKLFHRQVLFVRLLDTIEQTAARRIGLVEARAFERVHEATYRRFGFELVEVEPGTILRRLDRVLATARAATT